MNNFDVVIAYRCYPWISKKPKYRNDDKLMMIKFGLKSLVLCLWNLKAKFFIIADWIPEKWEKEIVDVIWKHDYEYIYTQSIWNVSTRNKQIDILLMQNDAQIVYFAEDDYLYQNNWEFKEWIELLKNKKADFVTLFDHPDYYVWNYHRVKHEYIVTEKRIWRTVPSTCLTFMTTKHNLKNTEKQLRLFWKWSCYDHTMRLIITHYNLYRIMDINLKEKFRKIPVERLYLIITRFYWWKYIIKNKRLKLYAPTPSICTHLEWTDISPLVKWDEIKQNLEN